MSIIRERAPWIRNGSLGLTTFAVAMSSTLVQTPIDIFIGNIYPVHIMAILLLALFFSNDSRLVSVRRIVTIAILASLLLSVPSMYMPNPLGRLNLMLQLASNAPLLILGVALISRMEVSAAKRFFTCFSLGMAAGVLVQMVLWPNPRDFSALLPIGSFAPTFTFSEPSWLATYCSLVMIGCLAVGSRTGTVAMVAVLLLADNRGAFLIAAVSIFLSFRLVWGNPLLRSVVLLVPFGISVGGVLSALGLLQSTPLASDDTLNSRYRVVRAELELNEGRIFPFGGEFFFETIHNQWWHELVILFGAPGLLILGLWGFVLAILLPRVSKNPLDRSFWIISGGMWSLFNVWQFNNGTGFGWSWLLAGMILGLLLIDGLRESRPVHADLERK